MTEHSTVDFRLKIGANALVELDEFAKSREQSRVETMCDMLKYAMRHREQIPAPKTAR